MQYVIDISATPTARGTIINGITFSFNVPAPALIPCTIKASAVQPGMYLCVLENGKSLCVEPDGSHVRDIDAGADNWDSPWTQAALLGDKLVYRSSGGTPRGYLVIG